MYWNPKTVQRNLKGIGVVHKSGVSNNLIEETQKQKYLNLNREKILLSYAYNKREIVHYKESAKEMGLNIFSTKFSSANYY